MFFSEGVLTKKGRLANIWLAAHWEKKLTKSQVTGTNIEDSVEYIKQQPDVPLALRLTGHLLLGVVKIYSRKVRYMVAECNEALSKIKLQAMPETRVDLPEKASTATKGSITLPERLTEMDLLLPDADISEFVIPGQTTIGETGEVIIQGIHLKRVAEITMEEFDQWYTDESATYRLTQPTPQSAEPSPLEIARRRISEVSEVGPPVPLPTEFMGETSPGVTPLKSPIEEEIERMEDEFLQAPVPLELETELEEEEAPVEKKKKKQKKGKAIYDKETEIQRRDFDAQLRDTRDIKRRRLEAPKTKEDIEKEMEIPRSIGDLFEAPSVQISLPNELQSLWKERVTAKLPEEVAEAERRRRAAEEFPELEDVPMPSIGHFDEEEEIPQLPPSVPVTPMSIKERRVSTVPERLESPGEEEFIASGPAAEVEVKDLFTEEFQKGKKEINFQELLDGRKRTTAARCFYQTLVLKSKNMIDVKQQEPYGPILITPMNV